MEIALLLDSFTGAFLSFITDFYRTNMCMPNNIIMNPQNQGTRTTLL